MENEKRWLSQGWKLTPIDVQKTETLRQVINGEDQGLCAFGWS
jgi:hypothetical protein